MKNSSCYPIKLVFILCALLIASCEKKTPNPDEDQTESTTIPNSLHIAFETPDWKRQIDCSHLDLYPSSVNDEVFYVFASSQSTLNTFVFSYPSRASELEKPASKGRYPVAEYANPTGPFQYGMKLPLDDDKFDITYGRLVSNAGDSETEFTEITEIKRVGTEGEYALFQIKGRYGFNSTLETPSGTEVGNYVKGTFHLKVRALID
ncbi:hypothetical protein [Parapedobacter indicus]|uniref:Lipoprotein n=1 Tax=Parapedobacter indicus TaxID=1477437 RepID=A0A1I3DIP2_9SPHI|nr:hypothetical protein [Parapedobacter indicus]PPL04686.1 hypothetical protein CLV26_101489 [Parapedobacter indicus]SFH86361.1 hypothetical protein SAMN05444682_101476 [Parapedobacter indicus]